jgi:hypothetical protein
VSWNTSSSGDYTIPNLPRATYDVKVQVAGFAVGETKGIKLNVGDQQDLNFKLALAETVQTVVSSPPRPLTAESDSSADQETICLRI